MLQLLLHLSGDGASSSQAVRTSSILNSVFASKVLNKVDYTSSVALRQKAAKPDVEMKDTSAKGAPGSAKQKLHEYLKQMRIQMAPPGVNLSQQAEPLSEDLIVRDLLFVFQGIQGQYIHYTVLEDAYVLQPQAVVSPSVRKIVNELCELGWLFKRVNEWLQLNF